METLPLCLLLYSGFHLPFTLCVCVSLYGVCVCVSPSANLCVRTHRERPLSESQEYIITQTKEAGVLFMNY